MTDLSIALSAGAKAILQPQWLAGRGRLAQSIRLEESGPGRISVLAIVILTAMLGLFLIWSSLTHLGEIAPASGEITPVGSVKRVQHLEGGIVAAIYTHEGDLVDEGQVLMELESGM